MIKLGCGAFSLLCLLVAVFLLWQSPWFPERLPSDAADWAEAWFRLFRNPIAAGALFSLCVAMALGVAVAGEFLSGLVLSLILAAASVLCLLGVLGARFPGFADGVIRFLK
jgi:hypothetical protein